MGRARKEMGFHARFKAVIKLAVFSKTIGHFDAVIVCCMIYDLEGKSLFMFFFCLRSTLEWIWQHDSFFFFFFINTFMKLGLLLGPFGMTELSKMCCFFLLSVWLGQVAVVLSSYLYICLSVCFFPHTFTQKVRQEYIMVLWYLLTSVGQRRNALYTPGRCLASVMFLSAVSFLGWDGKPGCCATQWFSMHLNYCSHLLPGTSGRPVNSLHWDHFL